MEEVDDVGNIRRGPGERGMSWLTPNIFFPLSLSLSRKGRGNPTLSSGQFLTNFLRRLRDFALTFFYGVTVLFEARQ